jgi:DNA-binding transcriptional regulator YdaS (Cro superfamily)
MNCADRLVALFGSQAEVARQFRLDRAVVNNWVKSGYVPARWAMEVERATNGQIPAVDVLDEATTRKPLRMKSRPDGESLFDSTHPGSHNMNEFAPAKRVSSFHPPQRTLLGPGPSEITPRVMAAMSLPAIGYLDPIFVEMMEELKSLLRYTYQTKNPLTFPVSGPGSVGMEFCFVNMVAPGDKVIVCRNGVFGGRMIENVQRAGGEAIPRDPNNPSDGRCRLASPSRADDDRHVDIRADEPPSGGGQRDGRDGSALAVNVNQVFDGGKVVERHARSSM